MNKIFKLLGILGMVFLFSCGTGDEEMDCPELGLNFGELCINAISERVTSEGVVNDNCECISEDIELQDERDDHEEDDESDVRGECFELVYPVSLSLPNGTSINIENAEDLEALFEEWEGNPTTDQRPEFIFPIQVILEDVDEIIDVTSKEGLERIYNRCENEIGDDDFEREECFSLVYPVDVILPDGQTVGAEDVAELEDIYDKWFEAHPDSREEPKLVFPIQVIFETVDRPIDVSSDVELERLYNRCNDEGNDDDESRFDCFEFVFPVGVTLPDGMAFRIRDQESLDALYDRWEAANPDSEEEPTLIFPVQIIFGDNDTPIDIDSEATLDRAYNRCDLDENREDCFELVYPVGVLLPDGTEVRAADEESLDNIYDRWFMAYPDSEEEPSLIFPIQIIIEGVDSPVVVLSGGDLDTIYERCENNGSGGNEVDCPELGGNIGDRCRLDNGTAGTITRVCTCE